MRRDQVEWKKHGKVSKNNTVVKTEKGNSCPGGTMGLYGKKTKWIAAGRPVPHITRADKPWGHGFSCSMLPHILPWIRSLPVHRKWSKVDGVAVVRVCCGLSMSAPVCSVPRAYQLLNASTSRNRICSAFSKSIYHWPNLKRFLYSFHEYVPLLIIIYWLLVINQPVLGTWVQNKLEHRLCLQDAPKPRGQGCGYKLCLGRHNIR